MRKSIVIDCETMKQPHSGLYHFCLQLGLAIKKKINNEKEKLTFYKTTKTQKVFGNEYKYINQHKLHKYIMPLLRANIWHTTFQSTRYFPFHKNSKIVLTIHDLNILHEKNASVQKIEKELFKLQKKIDRANHIVAISEFTKQDVIKNLKIGSTPFTVIYNGCNFEKIENPQTPLVEIKERFLFTIGFINAKKNFHVLPCLLVGNHKLLVIAGITDNSAYKEKILNEATSLGVLERVIFTGSISENDKQWYMKNCEAFVFPSLAEGFGLPVIEAMYFGKPVILSNLTALPEIGGDVAYYFDDFEPNNMRLVLSNALNHFENDTTAKEKIMARAMLFNWDTAAQKYLDIYRNLY